MHSVQPLVLSVLLEKVSVIPELGAPCVSWRCPMISGVHQIPLPTRFAFSGPEYSNNILRAGM